MRLAQLPCCCALSIVARAAIPLRRQGGSVGFNCPLLKPALPHKPLRPPIPPPHELANRQGVQELVCQQDRRALRHLRQIVVPHRIRHPRGLLQAQPGRRFDRMHRQRRPKRRHRLGNRPQRVRHQRSPPRPGLDQQHRRRRPQQPPRHRRPQAQNFPEHLADFRRGRKIRERIVGRVIRRVGPRHEGIQALRLPLGHQGDDRRISQIPARTIGMDNNCPIVAPAKRKPRNASGSRKNSPVMRANP